MGFRARLVGADGRGPVTVLTFEALSPFAFDAGQYIGFVHPDGDVPMSIASGPGRLPFFELHYRPVAGAPDAERMDALLAGAGLGRGAGGARTGGRGPTVAGDVLECTGPLGAVTARAVPTLLLAAGTGAAQATGFLEWLRERQTPPPTVLWWSVSSPADLYQDAYFADLSGSGWFDYRAFVDRPSGENTLLPALRGAPLADDVVLSGPAGFVDAAARVLMARGVARGRLRSDMLPVA